MFRSTLRRLAKTKQITGLNNPYKAQKKWPPDFAKLTGPQQFRLERRYRRRAKLRYQRPGWIRGVKLATYGITSTLFVYMLLFMDWGEIPGEARPFEDLREWVRAQFRSIWTVNSPTTPNPTLENPSRKPPA